MAMLNLAFTTVVNTSTLSRVAKRDTVLRTSNAHLSDRWASTSTPHIRLVKGFTSEYRDFWDCLRRVLSEMEMASFFHHTAH